MGVGNYLHNPEHYSEQFIVRFGPDEFDGFDEFWEGEFQDEVIFAVASALPNQFTTSDQCVQDYLERYCRKNGAYFIAESPTVEVFGLWYEGDFIIVLNVREDIESRFIHAGTKSVSANNVRVQKALLEDGHFELAVRTSAWTSGRVTMEDLK